MNLLKNRIGQWLKSQKPCSNQLIKSEIFLIDFTFYSFISLKLRPLEYKIKHLSRIL